MSNIAKKNKKSIVVIGGGTGTFSVLSGLKPHGYYLTAIVTMADDGGSTGVLREEFGILPPGDARRCLIALSSSDNQFLSELFNYRFKEGSLDGHAFGNLMITALERTTGSFEKALQEAGRFLGVENGEVLPVTLTNIRLFAELEDGTAVKGETNIDIPKHDGSLRIQNLWLEPKAKPNKKAVEAIKNADLIVIGPGDLYTSILPNLLVEGVVDTIQKSKAKKVYVCSLMTKHGETHGFVAKDFVEELEKYLGEDVLDAVILNKKKPTDKNLRRYQKEKSFFVDPFLPTRLGQKKPKIIKGDFVRKGELVRHSDKLAEVLIKLL